MRLLVIPMGKDSVIVAWEVRYPHTINPVKKISQFARSFSVINKIEFALSNFKLFVQDDENIYGYKIGESSTKDTFLIATRFTSSSYPKPAEVYKHINRLKSYASSAGATESGYPMLNVSTVDSSSFACMVAQPVNKIINGKGSIFFVRMVPGKFLITEVKGGPQTIRHAHKMMGRYYDDFGRQRMAIPFEYLLTDRSKETDTSKWVTRIYGPVK